jgi:DNA-binding MarR family transcriptional regulator
MWTMGVRRDDPIEILCAAVVADCACEGLRRAARTVSRVYGGALAGFDLTPTQLAILVGTRLRRSLPLSRLAEGLGLDRTSLYRAIGPLERRGYLKILPGHSQRERVAMVTAKGERVLQGALPAWERTQERFVEAIGPRTWTSLRGALKQVVAAAGVLESGIRAQRRNPGRGRSSPMR